MTLTEQAEIKAAIKFYEKRSWYWGDIVEFLAIKYNSQARVAPVPKRRVNWKGAGRPRKNRGIHAQTG